MLCDAIFARTLKHETILELARHAEVPVLNGLTDYNHPTQVVCDILTMLEHIPAGKRLEDLNVTFVGDATNVLSSLLLICTRLGMSFTQAAPEKYQAPPTWQAWAQQNCLESGGHFTITADPLAAVHQADFIYTDLWWWVGQEAEIPERQAAFMPAYQVNLELFDKAPAHCTAALPDFLIAFATANWASKPRCGTTVLPCAAWRRGAIKNIWSSGRFCPRR